MNSLKLLLFQLLIIGLMTSGLSKPSQSSESGNDYQNDDDSEDYDEESDQSSSQKQPNPIIDPKNPPFFKLSDYTETAKEGENVTLKCDVENQDSSFIYMWFRGENDHDIIFQNNFRVIPNDRFTLQTDHSLTISNVNASEAGTYRCQVLPSKIVMHAKLVVLMPLQASIYQGDRDITGRSITYRQNERIEFECKASGPEASKVNYKWSSGGERINSDNNIQINGGRLVINNATRDHVRLYQCLADAGNEGTSHASVTLNILYVPHVTAERLVVNTKEGDNAELYCHFESTTETRVVWRKDQKALRIASPHDIRSKYSVIYKPADNKNTSILVVSKIAATDLGEYECQVENIIGSEKVTIALTYLPEAPKLHNWEEEGKMVISHWRIRSLQPLKEVMLHYQQKGAKNWITESPIDQEQSKDHSGLWKIKHKLALSPGHWHVRVKAMNTEGWSQFSAQENIRIEEPKSNSANLGVSPVSCAMTIAALITIYSTRLFG